MQHKVTGLFFIPPRSQFHRSDYAAARRDWLLFPIDLTLGAPIRESLALPFKRMKTGIVTIERAAVFLKQGLNIRKTVSTTI